MDLFKDWHHAPAMSEQCESYTHDTYGTVVRRSSGAWEAYHFAAFYFCIVRTPEEGMRWLEEQKGGK